jgi:hypothetical protein
MDASRRAGAHYADRGERTDEDNHESGEGSEDHEDTQENPYCDNGAPQCCCSLRSLHYFLLNPDD